MDIVNRNDTKAFTTKDGSTIREILAYRNSVIQNQSLAEATVPVGGSTAEHYHPKSEEIYYILKGCGKMKIGGEFQEINELDGIAIPPGAPHKIWNTGEDELVLLCMCAPTYEHEDTVLLE
ncbi:MAG: cupin domain-containing protein [Verrucomicrobiota bacterium]